MRGYAAAQALVVTRHLVCFNDIPLEYGRLILVKNSRYEKDFPSATNAIARLIYEIAKSIGTKFDEDGSAADLTEAVKLFTNRGNKMVVDKNASNIRKTLKNYRNGIVLIRSRTKSAILGIIVQGEGHSYIADGYRIYSDGSDLIHINFGWGPRNNGYFLTKLTAPKFTSYSPNIVPYRFKFYCIYK